MQRTTTKSAIPQTQQWPQLTRLQLNKYEKANGGTAKRTTGALLDSARSKGSVVSSKQAVRGAEPSGKSPTKKEMNGESPLK